VTDKKQEINSVTGGQDNTFPTVLLHHATASGDHYDWMLAEPGDGNSLLRTFRVLVPSDQWTLLRRVDLEPIAPHRRIYLTYEGPIPGNRGDVQRIDEGTFRPIEWSDSRIEIDLKLRGCQARVTIVRRSEAHMIADFRMPISG